MTYVWVGAIANIDVRAERLQLYPILAIFRFLMALVTEIDVGDVADSVQANVFAGCWYRADFCVLGSTQVTKVICAES